jgi:mannose-6-phosphate isomerase
VDLLVGVVRNYDWGDHTAIAELLGHQPPGHPEAEYWLGAHPSAPSNVAVRGRTLDAVIADELVPIVGAGVAERFAGLPFLLKVLAAEQPLSIQAHPSLAQAQAGFARENAAGVDQDAPHRSYRDANHKPELICALTPFEAKCGFRPVVDSHRLISAMGEPELGPLARRLAAAGADADILADTVPWLLRHDSAEAAALVAAATRAADRLFAAADAQDGATPNERLEPYRTEMEWTRRIATAFPGDIGVVVALLLNHVSLKPGEAIFLQAGNLHSYLQGVGVELMANSDNVLRGGLTPKHIDVDELLRVVDYTPADAPVQRPAGPIHTYSSPVPEFSLTRLASHAGDIDGVGFQPLGPEILLVTSGEATLETAGETLRLATGSAALVRHDDGPYRVRDGAPGHTVAWRAALGSDLY